MRAIGIEVKTEIGIQAPVKAEAEVIIEVAVEAVEAVPVDVTIHITDYDEEVLAQVLQVLLAHPTPDLEGAHVLVLIIQSLPQDIIRVVQGTYKNKRHLNIYVCIYYSRVYCSFSTMCRLYICVISN